MPDYNYRQPAEVRQALIDGAEVALIDVREEAVFATHHPLFAANLPLICRSASWSWRFFAACRA